jgi:hemolysin activation/secretion protein
VFQPPLRGFQVSEQSVLIPRGRSASSIAVSVAFLLYGASAHAQVPPGATPGGALPRNTQQAPAAPAAGGELFSIPRVTERPLGVEEGPRVLVQSFRLDGATDRPEEGLRVADLQAVLDKARAEQPATGFTVNQLQGVADKISEIYHQKGFILAQAFIPAQSVRNGQVIVQVLEGRLSGVTVEGNKSYSSRALLRPFTPIIGSPVEKDTIESALLTLTNYPGVSAVGVLGAGQDVGTTNLTVRVQREDPFELDASVDNEGSRFAGKNRGQLSASFNDLAGIADRLRVYGLYAFDRQDSSANGIYGGVSYDAPVFSPRDSLHVAYSHNAYEVGNVSADIAALDSKGSSDIAELGYRHAFMPSRLGSSSVGLTAAKKDAVFRQLHTDRFEDKLSTLTLDYDWNRIDTRFRGINQFTLAYSHGFKGVAGALDDYDTTAAVPASRFGATGDFDKVTLNAQRLQRVFGSVSFLLRVNGQYSSDRLVSLEQVSIGGPDSVRAYPVAEVLADKGGTATGELILGAPGFADKPAFGNRTWGQVLQISFFFDYGLGEINDPLSNQPGTIHLAGYGGALQFNLPGRSFARLDVAKPTTDAEPTSGKDTQYYFRLAVTF